MADELDDGLTHFNDLDVTWAFGLDALLQEGAQQAPAAGEVGDRTTETMDLSQGGAADASSAPIGRTEAPETMSLSQGGAVNASSTPMGRSETAETMGSSQGGIVNASSVPAWRAESDPGAAPAPDTGQGNTEDLLAVQLRRPAHEVSSWGRVHPTVRGRTRGQSQRLEGGPAVHQLKMNDEVADALLATAHAWWTKPGSIPNRTSWATEDAVAFCPEDLLWRIKGS